MPRITGRDLSCSELSNFYVRLMHVTKDSLIRISPYELQVLNTDSSYIHRIAFQNGRDALRHVNTGFASHAHES